MGGEKQPLFAVPFDPHKRARSLELKAHIATITAELEAHELNAGLRASKRGPKGRHLFALAVEAVLCNFVVLLAVAPGRPLSLPLGHHMREGDKRNRSPVFGGHFNAAVSALLNIGLIETHTRGFRIGKASGQPSSFLASERLCESLRGFWSEEDITAHVAQSPNIPVLILKGGKDAEGERPILSYKPSTKTAKMAKRVAELNVWLAAAPVHITKEDLITINARTDEERNPYADPTRRAVRRSFVNGQWDQGGRLFGGFWEEMGREDRFAFLRIGNGGGPPERVANVDTGQLFPRLAYMRSGLAAPEGDLYDVGGWNEYRPDWKVLLNAMLFMEGQNRLGGWPRNVEGLRKAVGLRDAEDLLRTRHPLLVPLFGSGIGHTLMWIESELLLNFLEDLRTMNVYSLPLHDSVLVARSNAEAAKAVFVRRLAAILPYGGEAVVEIDTGARK